MSFHDSFHAVFDATPFVANHSARSSQRFRICPPPLQSTRLTRHHHVNNFEGTHERRQQLTVHQRTVRRCVHHRVFQVNSSTDPTTETIQSRTVRWALYAHLNTALRRRHARPDRCIRLRLCRCYASPRTIDARRPHTCCHRRRHHRCRRRRTVLVDSLHQ